MARPELVHSSNRVKAIIVFSGLWSLTAAVERALERIGTTTLFDFGTEEMFPGLGCCSSSLE
jgi:hypothetical protein